MKYFITFIIQFTLMANFPKNYEDSRNRFRKQVNVYKSYKIKSDIDKDLTIDYAYLENGTRDKTLLIINTGIHGPEAYLGSMALDIFIRTHLQNILDKDIDVFLIHALNPFGFKYHRRFTENNVDLNRNQNQSREIFRILNKDYQIVDHILNPKEKVNDHNTRFYKTLAQIGLKLITGTSFSSIRNATAAGQYHQQQGLFYGGKEFEENTLFIQNILAPQLNERSKILFLDFHTGLGDTGELHLITTSFKNQASREALNKIFPPSKYYKVTRPTDKGFYKANGDLLNFITNSSPTDAVLVNLAAEFGTVGTGTINQIDTISRMILENQGHFYGYENEDIKKQVKKDYLDLFYPQSEGWRSEVKDKVEKLFKINLQHFIDY